LFGGNMGRLFVAAFVVLGASLALAQDKLCSSATESSVDRTDGVIAEKVTLNGSWGSNVATFLRPDKDIVPSAIVFSHSDVHPDGRPSVSLLPLAMALARAGSAVIIPERTLSWLPQNESMNREGGVVLCAAHWIVEHTKVANQGEPVTSQGHIVKWRYAYWGPVLCDPKSPDCHQSVMPFNDEPQPKSIHDRVSLWVPLGVVENSDTTNRIISDGGLSAVKRLQQQLGLAPMQSIVSSGESSSAPN
jgi:hypothetical protein